MSLAAPYRQPYDFVVAGDPRLGVDGVFTGFPITGVEALAGLR